MPAIPTRTHNNGEFMLHSPTSRLSRLVRGGVAGLACAMSVAALAQTPAPAPTRIRGDIVSVTADSLVVHRAGADNVTIDFKSETPVGAVRPLKLDEIKQGSYIGAASIPGADGKLTAREVLVFPEAMRGSGDGHYDWDLTPGSKMTNANVDSVVTGTSGRELSVSYKGGTKTITVPENAPVVTFTEATRADVVAGKKVFIIATSSGPGKYEARRVIVEKNGVVPPM
jgi:hypothetical protein